MRRIAAPVFALLLTFVLPKVRADDASPAPSTGPAEIPLPTSPVVDPSRLMALLPDAPPGWTADKPEGTSSQTAGFPIATVSRTYENGDADNAPTCSIHIVDSANNERFQEATKAMWGATSDTPAGYDKAITVEAMPGFEHYANADKTGVLWVVAARRFFVQVETTGLPASDLQVWLKRLDLNKLAQMK